MPPSSADPLPRPELIVHADWSKHQNKRWMATARLQADGGYVLAPSQPVGDISSWLRSLRSQCSNQASILIGVDFPIGVPEAYAANAGIEYFSEVLQVLGHGEWADFYQVSTDKSTISLKRPFYPNNGGDKGERSKEHLKNALGVPGMDSLLRRCERKMPDRNAACSLFWTLGPNQVGKAAITGWTELLAPSLLGDTELQGALWPFAGSLDKLLSQGGIVIAETYPASYYRQLGVLQTDSNNRRKPSKAVIEHRLSSSNAIRNWATKVDVAFEPLLEDMILSGFGSDQSGEDRFDAFIGLCGMIDVIFGRSPSTTPNTTPVQNVEGWMLGLTF